MSGYFDILQSATRLREVGFDEPQAEALTGLLRRAQQADRARLASRCDRDALDGRMGCAIAKLDANIDRVAAELRTDFALIRSKTEILRRDLTIRLGSVIVVATALLLAAKFFG
jgi:hypothetical protein